MTPESFVILLLMASLVGVIGLLAISSARGEGRLDTRRLAPQPPPPAAAALRRLAEELGADPSTDITVGLRGTHRLSLANGGVRLTAEVRVDNMLRLAVDGPDLPSGARIEAWDGLTSDRIMLGDPAFDAAVRVTGNPVDLIARLPAATRAVVRSAIAVGVVFDHGRWQARIAERGDGDQAVELAQLLLRAADALRLEGSVGAILFARLRSDETLTHRRRSLEALLAGRLAQRDAAIAFGLGSGDPEMILAAAAHAGPEAVPALRGLINGSSPSAADHGVSLRALDLIAGRVRRAAAIPLIETCLRQGISQPEGADALLVAALRHAATFEHLPQPLLDALIEHPADAVREALPAAAAATGPAADPSLLRLLDDRAEAVAMAAARAAGEAGTLSLVAGLHAVIRRTRRSVVRRAAEAAVAQIQSRVGRAEARGGLALSAPDPRGGGLSAPAAQVGALSPSALSPGERASD